MMARLLWMYSVSVTSLSDLYRKGLSGASTQLSYFSSKRKKKIQVRCQRKIWLSCRQCSFALGIGGFPKKLNATIPTGDFTKLDFEAYNGPSRGYSVLFKVKKA
ncbi:uncharacterized protein [Coffea arabica]|uniref:Uncharacterized protein isoform X6 n=1 Tax=Coffea arabica TaxID=13443 RepID=A0ABM4VVQ8_COFAR